MPADATRAILFLGAIAVATLLGAALPLPGVDHAVLQSFGYHATMPVALPSLLLFGGLATWDPLPKARWLWPALFALTAGLHGWTHAAQLEQVSGWYGSVVFRPGLVFRLQTTASTLGLSAVLWLLARASERTGRVRGVLWVAGVLALSELLAALPPAAAGWALGEPVPIGVLAPLAAAALTLGVWGAVCPTSDRLRSAWDALFLPPALVMGIRGVAVAGPVNPWIMAAAAAVGGLVAVVAVVARGSSTRPAVLPLVGAALLPLAALGLAGLGIAVHPLARAQLLEPGPLDGPVDATLVLTAPDPGPRDADVLARRLAHLGIDHSLSGSGGRVELELRDVRGVKPVLDAVLPKNRIVFREVVGPEVAEGSWDCASPNCGPLLLGPVELDHTAIADATVGINASDGRPYVRVDFTPAGRNHFSAWTTAHVGDRIAIVLDDQIVSAPTILEPILGGSAHVDMGDSRDPESTAHALAAALGTVPLEGRWVLAEQR